ncbi:Type I inositol polyphosphate 5-phosphatase 1 [Rhynchospora pubera]|uniref:Type I inositol polyphosphate 5-phosphatase 1 n=1 Tax=Rhynchospora pubera TaxID=906938 RepID=A0AAV8FGA7_9POAL|nr:Type I inositol polyphosphate 5-phosphatase 1 [Rhynchospora pubera]
MRDDTSNKSKLSWSKTLVRKWFNLKTKAKDFHADCTVTTAAGEAEWTEAGCTVKKSRTERSKRNLDRNRYETAYVTDKQDYRVFVATWNVGGKSPPDYLSVEDWLLSSAPADIYVLGFQEIVPLNAGNVLGTEDSGPAKKWVALIRRTLNKLPGSNSQTSCHTPSPAPDPIAELDADFEASRHRNPAFFHRRSFQALSRSLRADADVMMPQVNLGRRFSVCERISFSSRPSDFDDEENYFGDSPCGGYFSPMVNGYYGFGYGEQNERFERSIGKSRYCLVASKQMVGIFLMIWVRNEIRPDVKNLKVSCVGRGLMGYLGNKGSISISMALHQTSFCFVCTHLTSGQKEGDELRRNSDVVEILRKTRFPRVDGVNDENSPQTILEHDRVIWLGDLNYRIALSYRSVKALVEMHNWKHLLEKDQLRIEQRSGRVFEGWKEGRIYFPPTYKYSNNSDRYAGDDLHPKEKRRTPAWCDRILWYGRGLNQLCYVRGESRFSDHRPVYSIFTTEVDITRTRLKRGSCPSSRVEVEELLPSSHGFMDLNFY